MTFIMLTSTVSSFREPITSSYLRELAVQVQNEKFDARINEIVEEVIAHASENRVKYSTMIRFLPLIEMDHSSKSVDRLSTKPAEVILTRLQEILIDAKLTMTPQFTHCNDHERVWYQSRMTCKELIIEW